VKKVLAYNLLLLVAGMVAFLAAIYVDGLLLLHYIRTTPGWVFIIDGGPGNLAMTAVGIAIIVAFVVLNVRLLRSRCSALALWLGLPPALVVCVAYSFFMSSWLWMLFFSTSHTRALERADSYSETCRSQLEAQLQNIAACLNEAVWRLQREPAPQEPLAAFLKEAQTRPPHRDSGSSKADFSRLKWDKMHTHIVATNGWAVTYQLEDDVCWDADDRPSTQRIYHVYFASCPRFFGITARTTVNLPPPPPAATNR
jgi:hypothetical protein